MREMGNMEAITNNYSIVPSIGIAVSCARNFLFATINVEEK